MHTENQKCTTLKMYLFFFFLSSLGLFVIDTEVQMAVLQVVIDLYNSLILARRRFNQRKYYKP